MRRGDLYLAELSPRSGAEIQGGRPVLVVSHDSFNRVTAWQSVMVVPLTTSAAQARRGDGVAVCHQITTLDRTKLSRRLGALPADVLAAVELGIKAALDLP